MFRVFEVTSSRIFRGSDKVASGTHRGVFAGILIERSGNRRALLFGEKAAFIEFKIFVTSYLYSKNCENELMYR